MEINGGIVNQMPANQVSNHYNILKTILLLLLMWIMLRLPIEHRRQQYYSFR